MVLTEKKRTLNPGRWLGLRRTSTDGDHFAILAIDQRRSFHQMCPPGTTDQQVQAIKREVISALTPHTSAVLLDNEYGVEAALHTARSCGLLFALEMSGFGGEDTRRDIKLDSHWTPEKLKRFGATAIKLLVYYNPALQPQAEQSEKAIREIVEQAHALDMPVFLEPMSYSITAGVRKESADFASERPELVVESVRRLTKTGVDILKLESPVDVAFEKDEVKWGDWCSRVTSEATVPWVLLSAGVDFPVFERQLAVACESGASGFLAGRAIWKEAIPMSAAERESFLRGEAVERTERLNAVVEQKAVPWTTYYEPMKAEIGWHTKY